MSGPGGAPQPSAATPASADPAAAPAPAPAPLIALQGKGVVRNAFANTINSMAAPFQQITAPGKSVLERVNGGVSGVMGLMNAPAALLDTGIAAITAPLAAMLPSFPAATLTALHVGMPHPHAHPPSLIPPAPPVPLPSIGTVMLPGCVSVLIGGLPAARVGDVGLAVTCGSLSPVLEIFMGSSKVFIGGKRAARMLDMTKHCMPSSPMSTMAKVMTGVGVGAAILGAAAGGNALAAAMTAAQQAADMAALAMKQLLGKDPGLTPDMGMLMIGNPTVLIGGFPLPDSSVILEGLKKLAKGLARGVRGGRAQGRLFCADCM
ncbi:MAG TPA: PAAR domain-containing protein [Polyangia bacterium]|jgi:uncharacterized Zn-binding protein involved in type VI secretion|nr:PAAR domain-containing protein [Polyangia bacterium]